VQDILASPQSVKDRLAKLIEVPGAVAR